MIQSIEIQNFQSHKNSLLEFHPGVNVIIGLSDSGKSAIIRAMKWLIWNRPTGDSFRSKFGGKTVVILSLNGNKIERIKSDHENSYIINDKLKFEAIKTDVPDEIQKILNFDKINLQQQADNFFLLNSTPGEAAIHFNKIAHLENIDKSIKNIQSWIKGIEQDIKSKNSSIIDLQETLKQFDFVDKLEANIEVLENEEKILNNKIRAKNELDELINSIKDLEIQINKESTVLKWEDKINNAIDLIKDRNERQKTVDGLSELIEDLKILGKDIDKYYKELCGLEDKFKKEFPDICPLCGTKIKKL